jgi:hypothetical protein
VGVGDGVGVYVGVGDGVYWNRKVFPNLSTAGLSAPIISTLISVSPLPPP